MKTKRRKGFIPAPVILAIAVAAAILLFAGTIAHQITTFPWWGFGAALIITIAIVLFITKKYDSK